ncbi:hypothetical protein IC582_027610 [Cucumis melo]
MSNFSFKVIIGVVMSFLNSSTEIQENSIQFSMEMEFFEFFLELTDYFEILSKTLSFNETIVTSAKTKDETLRLFEKKKEFEKKKRLKLKSNFFLK